MDRLDLSAKREDMVIMAPKGPPRNRNRRLLGAGTRTSLLWDPAMGALWRAQCHPPCHRAEQYIIGTHH